MDIVSAFCIKYLVSPAHLLKRLSFLHCMFLGDFVKNQFGIAVWIHIWIFYSVLLVFISVFVPAPCCFYCCGSVVYFEVKYCDTSSVALFAQYCLGYSRSLVFPNEL
jgi:hypothetical protein